MPNKTRLAKVERTHAAKNKNTACKIYVLHEGDDFVTCNGEKLLLAEFEKIKDKDTVLLKVVRASIARAR